MIPHYPLPESDLGKTLIAASDVLAVCKDPWWVITGAAAALHGETSLPTSDVDILLSTADAPNVAERIGARLARGTATETFHSEVFFRWHAAPLPVEFMAHFRVRESGRWERVLPRSRASVLVGEKVLYVPDRPELIDMFRRFGRPKDLIRAQGLASV